MLNDPCLRAELVEKGYANVAKYRAGAVAAACMASLGHRNPRN